MGDVVSVPDHIRLAAETAQLAERLRLHANNVEEDGWLNAARVMRIAADELDAQISDDDGQPDEAQEWADFDPEC